ncbi:MAG: NAD(+) diphosphatase [Pseudoxanthomonas sp.]
MPLQAGPLSGFSFVDAPLDRADALRDDPAALARLWPQARVVVVDAQGNALADAAGGLLAPTGAQLGGGPGQAVFLGLRGEQGWFAQQAELLALQAPGRLDLRTAAAQWAAADATAFAQARALLHWRSRCRHCGLCGGAVEFVRAGWSGVCTRCQAEHYPRVDPAVIVAVSDGSRLLLGRQAGWPPGRHSVVAGFVEPGETLEQAAAREVLEETRVRVRAARYLGSQPWPFPGALMLGFEADAEPDPPQVDGELEHADWYERAQVGAALRGEEADGLRLPPPLSIARALIGRWYRQGGGGPD